MKHEGHACVSPGFHPKAHLGAAFLSLRRERRRPEEGEGRAAPHLSLPGAGTRGRRGWQGRPDTGRATRAPQHGRHTHLSGSCPALRGNGRESAGGRPSTLSGTLERLKHRCAAHLPLRGSVRGAHAPNIPAAISDRAWECDVTNSIKTSLQHNPKWKKKQQQKEDRAASQRA